MNQTRRTPLARPTWAALVLASALASTPALAAHQASQTDAYTRYQRERAQCDTLPPQADRANCLREAGAAYAEARAIFHGSRAGADDDTGRYARNALKRCEPLPAPDRKDCVLRMQGHGTISGSVIGGGLYRELVTVEIGSPVVLQAEESRPLAPPR